MKFSSSSHPLVLSLRAWSPRLWRLRRWKLSHQRLLMTRMGRAALDHDIIPARESGRFDLHAQTGRLGDWAGFNPACRKAIPTHCLHCCCGALRALASLSACLPVCLHGKTWLPSFMLQACYMLVNLSHLIGNLVHLLVSSVVHSIESFYKNRYTSPIVSWPESSSSFWRTGPLPSGTAFCLPSVAF